MAKFNWSQINWVQLMSLIGALVDSFANLNDVDDEIVRMTEESDKKSGKSATNAVSSTVDSIKALSQEDFRFLIRLYRIVQVNEDVKRTPEFLAMRDKLALNPKIAKLGRKASSKKRRM